MAIIKLYDFFKTLDKRTIIYFKIKRIHLLFNKTTKTPEKIRMGVLIICGVTRINNISVPI